MSTSTERTVGTERTAGTERTLVTDRTVGTGRTGMRARLRRAAGPGRTTPERLRRVAAVLVVGCLATAALSAVAGLQRTDDVEAARTRIADLNADAGALYQAIAEADATATSGYLLGSREPAAVRARYDESIARATDRLAHAAAAIGDGDPSAGPLATITAQLPVYTGLVEAARATNRQGLPLGQSYLGTASRLARSTILPAADALRRMQADALARSSREGAAFPVAVLLVGVATLVAVVDLAVRERRRTRRMLDARLIAGAAALAVALLWWVSATAIAGAALDEARGHGDAATALDEARTALLQARSGESLLLIARGGGATSDRDVTGQIDRVLGAGGDPGLLAVAGTGPPGALDPARAAVVGWRDAHRDVERRDDGGDYPGAVASATGTGPGTAGAAFRVADDALAEAVAARRVAFDDAVGRADVLLTGLPLGPALLAVLAAAATLAAIARRTEEYR